MAKNYDSRWQNFLMYVGLFRYGKWRCGRHKWKGKPKFGFYCMYYDGPMFCFHLGSYWVDCNYE
jgi:hypothetical protein